MIQLNVERAIKYKYKIAIWGWAFSEGNKIEKIILNKGKDAITYVLYGINRPDVVNLYPYIEEAKNSGFYIYLNLNFIWYKKAVLEFHLLDGEIYTKKLNLKEIENENILANLKNTRRYNTFLALQKDKFDNKQGHLFSKEPKIAYKPLISIIVPTYNIDSVWLNKCIQSVLFQLYENWELCLHDDGSTSQSTLMTLKEWEGKDPRIKISYSETNDQISIATNKAIQSATGEFVSFLDHDDELTKDALLEVVFALNKQKDLDLIYTDEDKIDEYGNRSGHYFKSDFDIDLLCSNNYICHFVTIRKEIGDKIGWLKKGYEGAQDHDFLLRFVEQTKQIHHIPKVLYHWRTLTTSTASGMANKSYAIDAGIQSISDYLDRNDIDGEVFRGNWDGSYRVKRRILSYDKVSIIIPFKDQIHFLKTCIDSIFEKTIYPNFELLLINNNSEEEESIKYLEQIKQTNSKIKIFDYTEEFNYSAINNWAVEKVDSEYILLLNNDIKVKNEGWLENMVEHIQRPEVGAVGAKLSYRHHTIQHAGVVIGIKGRAGHVFKGLPFLENRYYNMNLIKQYSACTAAVLLTKKSNYKQVGGLDEVNLKIAFNDVDYCLKLREKGFRVIFTPYAELFHFESISRGYEHGDEEKMARSEREAKYLNEKWKIDEFADPFYNPNLTLEYQDNSITLRTNYKKVKVL